MTDVIRPALLDDKALQSMPEADINATLHALLVRPGLTMLCRDEPLPYCFDLFHDIKMWHEVDSIFQGQPHCSGLGADELRKFAEEMGYLLDHPVVSAYTHDWSVAGKVLAKLYSTYRLSLASDGDRIRASCIDSKGFFHEFHDAQPLPAAMRCAIAVNQVAR